MPITHNKGLLLLPEVAPKSFSVLAYKMADIYSFLFPAGREQRCLISAAASSLFPYSVNDINSNPVSAMPSWPLRFCEEGWAAAEDSGAQSGDPGLLWPGVVGPQLAAEG